MSSLFRLPVGPVIGAVPTLPVSGAVNHRRTV